MIAAFAVALATVQPSPILHYVRSNIDGSQPEHVVHYRPSRREISVYKWVSKCTTSAYVTAWMDERVQEGTLFVAGKVTRDGSQARFGTLTLDPARSTLVADVTPPGGPRIQESHPLKSRPFLLYDFDFADLNSFLQEHRPQKDFSFELPVIWPGQNGVFRDLGLLRAAFGGEEDYLGRKTIRFDLTVTGTTPSSGTLWIDAEGGHIVEARLGLPNHQEYRDFRLTLEKATAGGKAAWDGLTASQYADCPAGN